MSRRRPWRAGRPGMLVFIGLCSLVARVAAVDDPLGQDPVARPSNAAGVYSEAQARRGLLEYVKSCEHCHGTGLTGNPTDEVPALIADAFLFHWRGRTAEDLFTRISKSMPADAPGTLEARAYLDLVAFLLESNGFPPGPDDLDRARLRAITMDATSPASRQPR